MTAFLPKIAVPFFAMTVFFCGPLVSRERKKIDEISDPSLRVARERALLKKIRVVGLGFVAAALVGYFIGRTF